MESSEPSKPRTWVSLRIFAPELIPDEITAILKVQPDRQHLKGDYPNNNPKYSAYKNGMWSLDSKLPEEESFEAHLDNVLSAVEPNAEYILRLSQTATVDFYCVLFDQIGFQLSPQILQRIVNIGATLGVSVEPPMDEANRLS
jgi:hypothetical protein